MDFVKTIFASKYGDGAVALNGSLFDTLLGKSLGGDTPAPVMPSKGDIIAVDMNGDGTAENYLVLKVNGSVAEVLARVSLGISTKFNESAVQAYANSLLDVALNTTYYDTFSATAKAAIVDKTFTQDKWDTVSSGNPLYNCTYIQGSATRDYQISLLSNAVESAITRHVYALSTQDIIDYLGTTPEMTSENTTFNTANLCDMFNLTYGIAKSLWLSSEAQSPKGLIVYGLHGRIYNTAITSVSDACPAFQIDLSKIAWTPSNS